MLKHVEVRTGGNPTVNTAGSRGLDVPIQVVRCRENTRLKGQNLAGERRGMHFVCDTEYLQFHSAALLCHDLSDDTIPTWSEGNVSIHVSHSAR